MLLVHDNVILLEKQDILFINHRIAEVREVKCNRSALAN